MNKQVCLLCLLAFLVGYFFKDITGMNLMEGATNEDAVPLSTDDGKCIFHKKGSIRELDIPMGEKCCDILANNDVIEESDGSGDKVCKRYNNNPDGFLNCLLETNDVCKSGKGCTPTMKKEVMKALRGKFNEACSTINITKGKLVEGIGGKTCSSIGLACDVGAIAQAGVDPAADIACASIDGVCLIP